MTCPFWLTKPSPGFRHPTRSLIFCDALSSHPKPRALSPSLLYQAAGLWVLDTICFHIPMSCFLRTISDWGRVWAQGPLSQGGPHTQHLCHLRPCGGTMAPADPGLGLLPQSRAYVWGGCRAHSFPTIKAAISHEPHPPALHTQRPCFLPR